MSFLRSSAPYQFLITHHSFRWMPCQSWAFLRWPGFDGFLRLLVVVLLWSMFAEIRYIPSSSMYPTLRVGDRILIEKASYLIRRPAVQDIVIFQAPSQQPGFAEGDILIKRIVAGAGDLVEVNHGWLYVNGIAQYEDYIAAPPSYKAKPTYVPEGHVYVLGDNRENSCDSHIWITMVHIVVKIGLANNFVSWSEDPKYALIIVCTMCKANVWAFMQATHLKKTRELEHQLSSVSHHRAC